MKKYLQQSRLLLLLFLLFCRIDDCSLHAMDGINIAFKASLSGKIDRKWSFLIEEDIRPKVNFRQAEWFLTTGEINYSITPHLKAGAGYMLLAHHKASDELRNRYYFYASVSHALNSRFTLSLRERFQSTYKVGTDHPKNYLRSMLTLSYKAGKSGFTPFTYAELFNDTGYKGRMHTDRIRLSSGSDYRLNTHNSLQLYYRYHLFNAYDPVNYKHAIGISYSHSF